ncbi:uncharacterized protein WCC33_011925 isoform 2-T2 [Rhinophrynus dorsalis]
MDIQRFEVGAEIELKEGIVREDSTPVKLITKTKKRSASEVTRPRRFDEQTKKRIKVEKIKSEESCNLKPRRLCRFDEETRAARRAKLMEELQAMISTSEPCFQDDPVYDVKDEEESVLDESKKRSGKNDWCTCQNCPVMDTEEESICCREIPSIGHHLGEDHTCITNNPNFSEMCLNWDRLDYLFRFLGKTSRRNAATYYDWILRRTAYRAFTIWAYTYLCPRTRRPIPACVVKSVRACIPVPEGLYTGFDRRYDFPAVDMAVNF